jgi:hypothetical protein
MPVPRSHTAPYFSGQANDPLADFLHEYDTLANSYSLTNDQKVDTILRYVPSHVREFWKTLDGYINKDWTALKNMLESLYPDTTAGNRYTKTGLQDFVNLSGKTRIMDEDDLTLYYRRFLQLSNPLRASLKLSDDERNTEFFYGFHPDDRSILENRLFAMNPTRPIDKAPAMDDTIKAARSYFSNTQFHRPLHRRIRDSSPPPSSNHRAMEQWFGRDSQDPRSSRQRDHERDRDTYRSRDFSPQTQYSHEEPVPQQPEYTTKTVRFQDSKSPREEEDLSLSDLIRKMHGLSIRDANYAVLYAQCKRRFPEIAQDLAKPEMFQASSAFTVQTPASLPWPQPQPPVAKTTLDAPAPAPAPIRQTWTQRPQLSTLPSDASSFFKPRPITCAFCTQSGHMVRRCPLAQEYVNSGRASIINERIHLPNGQPIPNDGSSRGLKHGIDTWLAANSASTEPPPPSIQPTATITFQREVPPHATLSYEVINREVHMTQITSPPDPEVAEEFYNDDLSQELYNLHEVLGNERKRRADNKTSKPQDTQPVSSDTTPAHATSSATAQAAQSTSNSHRPAPQFRYQSNAEDHKLTNELFSWLLEGKLSQATPAHILAASGPIRKDLADKLRTRRVEAAAFETHTSPQPHASSTPISEPEYSLPLQEIDILVGGRSMVAGVIDPGSQIVAIRKDLADEVAARINPALCLKMEGANSATNWTLGCAEHLDMQVGDVPFKIHAHVVENAPYRLLLGRPFQHHLLCSLEDKPDGRVDITIRDPRDRSRLVSVPSRERRMHVGYIRTLSFQSCPPPPCIIPLEPHFIEPWEDPTTPSLAYKKVANKVHPVSATLPEDFRIIRRRPEDPLLSLPPLPTRALPFSPGSRLTQERLEELDLNRYNFLWPEELNLAQHVLKINEKALAWTEAERGRFRDEYFTPVKIPTVAHTPWVHKNIPIPTGILDHVIDLFKKKIAAGVYEPSDASYRSRWFCVKKKNGSLRIVHDLQPLNAVTIRNAAVPPFVDQFVEGMAARACYSMLDLFVGYDHRALDISSRDLTTFQTPLGAYRCTVLPQGSTNAVAIFHGDVTFLLEPEIPDVAKPFLDDTAIRGPASRYETPGGGYETIPENAGIRRFIWEHLNDVHRVLHRLGHAGATVSAPKLFLAAPEVVILGHKCTYQGRVPEDSKTAKIKTWPPCKTVTDVRAFLGTAGTMRIWIRESATTQQSPGL